MKRLIRVITVLILLLLITGCWNNRDLTDLAVVTGLGIDLSENQKIELTLQVIKPSALRSTQDAGHSEEKAYTNITVEGRTLFEAIRNVITYFDRRAYFAHVQVIVIGEELAAKGIGDILDLFERDSETRRRAELIIAKDMKAREILDVKSELQAIPSIQLYEGLKTSDDLSKASSINLFELLKELSHGDHSVLIPVIHCVGSEARLEDLKVEGMAVIKKNMLIGYVTPEETRGFMFAKNKLGSTILVLASPVDQEKLISIEVTRSEGKIQADIKEGKPLLRIEIKTQGNIGEQQDEADLTGPESMMVLEQEAESLIREEIEALIKSSQERLRTDIFGFIDKIEKNHPREWKKIHTQWDELYVNLNVEVKVDFHVRTPGLIKQPATTR